MSEKEEKKINMEGLSGNTSDIENEEKKAEDGYEEELKKLKHELLLALADAQNLQKRHAKEKEDLAKFAVSSALTELTVPFQHLFSALKLEVPQDLQSNNFVKSLFEGIIMVQKEFEKVFIKFGLKRVYPEGEKFDPNFHQAVSQVEDIEKEPGTIISVVAAGFSLHGRIIRPAMVVVSKGK